MKKIYINILIIFIVSCFRLGRSMNNKPIPNDILDFRIKTKQNILKGGKNIKIELIFENKSDEVIYISDPICYGVNIIPYFSDSTGNYLQVKFRIRTYCKEIMKRIDPYDKYSTFFIYNLYECFDLSENGTYLLYFLYNGRLLDKNKNIISDKANIKSKILSIHID